MHMGIVISNENPDLKIGIRRKGNLIYYSIILTGALFTDDVEFGKKELLYAQPTGEIND